MNAIDRFTARVEKSQNGCWNWTGTTRGNPGYGSFWYMGRMVPAHVFSYWHHCGSIPTGHLILHSCDNPRCVNPRHLSTGTQKDNMADCCRKNRISKGENHWHVKLTAQQVSEIRKDRKHKSKELAALYGISLGYVYNLRRGYRWKNLPKENVL